MSPEELSRAYSAAFPNSRHWSADEFASLLADPQCKCFGDSRCFALTRKVLDEIELITIATNPDHRRQGLARSVMALWMKQAKAVGTKNAFLEVAADNKTAQALYADCGFTETGRRKAYYRRSDAPSVDALILAYTF